MKLIVKIYVVFQICYIAAIIWSGKKW